MTIDIEMETYNKFGAEKLELGRYEEAEKLFTSALALAEHADPTGPACVACLNNLTELFLKQLETEKAKPYCIRSLEIAEKCFGADHPNLLRTLQNLAVIYSISRNYKDCLPLYQRALSIRVAQLGSEHTDVASDLMELAWVHQRLGRATESEALYKQALSIRENLFGTIHAHVTQSMYELGSFYLLEKRYQEAETLLKISLAIREKIYTCNYIEMSECLSSLAEIYQANDRPVEAKLAQELNDNCVTLHFNLPHAPEMATDTSLAIRELVLDSDDPDIVEALECLEEYCSRLEEEDYDDVDEIEDELATALFEHMYVIEEQEHQQHSEDEAID